MVTFNERINIRMRIKQILKTNILVVDLKKAQAELSQLQAKLI